MVKIGDRIKIRNQDGQYTKWAGRTWVINHIAHSIEEHQGYDASIGGPLVSCDGLPVSLYQWEIQIVSGEEE